jgi:hypothetical protein
MKPISREALRKYYVQVLNKPMVIKAIQKSHKGNKNTPKLMEDFIPTCQFHDKIAGFNERVAGYSMGTSGIHIANWILRDSSQAKAVVRHEVAHLVQHYTHKSCKPHGKEFTEALKIVSPTTWRRDRHWQDNPEVAEARKECERSNKIHLT